MNKPDEFKDRLQEVMSALFRLMDTAKEREAGLEQKTGFEASGQFERPHEFLQSLLDMARVSFEPEPPGTFFLNSNMDFLYDGIPSAPFRLGYASVLSEAGEPFAGFWKGNVALHIAKCGYDLDKATALYAAVTTGNERYGTEFITEVSAVLDCGFSASEALDLLASGNTEKTVHAGYCLDDAIGKRIRLSIWFFLPAPKVLKFRG